MATYAVFDGLPTETQATLRSYVKDTSGVFASLLDGMILYGSAVRGEFLPGRSNLNVLLLLTSHERAALTRYARAHKKWAREQIVVPLFLTESELHASVASFPLEYVEIQEHHRLLAGRDPFIGLHVETTNLGLESARMSEAIWCGCGSALSRAAELKRRLRFTSSVLDRDPSLFARIASAGTENHQYPGRNAYPGSAR